MSAAAKRKLLFEPLMALYQPYGFFTKGSYMWRIDCKEKFVISISAELSRIGDIMRVNVCFGSFYAGVVEEYDKSPVPEGMITLKVGITEACYDDMDAICHRQTQAYIEQLTSDDMQALFCAATHREFIAQCEKLTDYKTLYSLSEKRAWDYLLLEGKAAALAHLDRLLSILYEKSATQENLFVQRCVNLRERMDTSCESELETELQKRIFNAEEICRRYFGERRWKQLLT